MSDNFTIYPSLAGKTVYITGCTASIGATIMQASAAQGIHSLQLPLHPLRKSRWSDEI